MSHKSVLGYLKKKGQTNTFRLATDLGVDRHKLLDIIKKLEGKKLIEFRHGIVKFLKFPEKIKKASKKFKKLVEAKKAISKPKKELRCKEKKAMAEKRLNVLGILRTENKEFKERFLALEKTIKELQEKASAPPKIIRRTIVKNKFKLPKFNLNWIKNIDLNKNIQQLHVPGILRIKQ